MPHRGDDLSPDAHLFTTPRGNLRQQVFLALSALRPEGGRTKGHRAVVLSPRLLQEQHLFSAPSSSLGACKALCTRAECYDGGYDPKTSRCYCAGGCLKAKYPGLVLPPSAFSHDPSLPGGSAQSTPPSAFSHDPSLPGGSAQSTPPSAFSHDPSLPGGSAQSTPSHFGEERNV